MTFRFHRATILAACIAGLSHATGAQARPSPEQAQQLLQNPDLLRQLQSQLRSSGLTPEQIRSRLRAQGYPESLLDAYLPNATGAASMTGLPSDDVFGALRSLGLADTITVDSLR